MEEKRFFILKPPEGQTSSLSSSSSSSSSSTSSFGAIEEIRAQGGTLYLALGEASRQRKLLELASFPSMNEIPQAEGWRARQEHGVLVARGLAEGVAKIVEEATFTDALGTEFGLGYKLQRLERRAEESFADGYGQGAKDAAKGIELEKTTLGRWEEASSLPSRRRPAGFPLCSSIPSGPIRDCRGQKGQCPGTS